MALSPLTRLTHHTRYVCMRRIDLHRSPRCLSGVPAWGALPLPRARPRCPATPPPAQELLQQLLPLDAQQLRARLAGAPVSTRFMAWLAEQEQRAWGQDKAALTRLGGDLMLIQQSLGAGWAGCGVGWGFAGRPLLLAMEEGRFIDWSKRCTGHAAPQPAKWQRLAQPLQQLHPHSPFFKLFARLPCKLQTGRMPSGCCPL